MLSPALLMRICFVVLTGVALTLFCSGAQAALVPIDLRSWFEESYETPGVWEVAPDGSVVAQTLNGDPTLFCSNFNARNTDLEGLVMVESLGIDDDLIGFALGFRPGQTLPPGADYLMIDWKRVDQGHDFPPCTPGSNAVTGLAISRVFGVPTSDELWGHQDFDAVCSPLGDGAEEIARSTTLGSVGWEFNRTYSFRFVFTPTSLQVFVDGTLEFDLIGSFPDGRFCFYNFSQPDAVYSSFTFLSLDVSYGATAAHEVPEGVFVSWSTLSEEDTFGFEVWGRDGEGASWKLPGLVYATGSGSAYEVVDRSPAASAGQAAAYRIVERTLSGAGSATEWFVVTESVTGRGTRTRGVHTNTDH